MAEQEERHDIHFSESAKEDFNEIIPQMTREGAAKLGETLHKLAKDPDIGIPAEADFTPEQQEQFKNLINQVVVAATIHLIEMSSGDALFIQMWFENRWALDLINKHDEFVAEIKERIRNSRDKTNPGMEFVNTKVTSIEYIGDNLIVNLKGEDEETGLFGQMWWLKNRSENTRDSE